MICSISARPHQGVDLFLAECEEALNRDNPWQALIRIGHRSWRKKHLPSEGAPNSGDPSKEVKSETRRPEALVWTPEAVSKTMISILRRCGFLLRRSRWLTMLSESTIAWQPQNEPPKKRRLLIFQSGAICHRRSYTATDPLPEPPGGHLCPKARRANLDLPAYDRLRVLTTELRRLVAEARSVTIRLNRRASINNKQLSRLFKWI